MGPTLHNWYSAEDAIAAFGPSERPESFNDGRFIDLPSAVLCFVTVGETLDEPNILSPSRVMWRAKQGIWPPNQDQWSPRNHHMFLRTPAEDRFFYAGESRLVGYGDIPVAYGIFSLRHKLPRDAWLKLGGYPGWLVEVNHQCHRVAAGELPTFERLVGQLAGQEFSHLCMTRYEEDSLTVHTNATRGWLMYLRFPGDNGVYTRDLSYSGPPEAEEFFRCVCGIDLEFKEAQTLPRELVGRAAIEFFQTGCLPKCVHWDLE